MRVLIAGGGIGGLVLALALLRNGTDCTVFERSSDTPAGSGLALWSPTLRTLSTLGIPLDDISAPFFKVQILSNRGHVLLQLPDLARPAGVALHRGELHRRLIECLPRERVVFGTRFLGFRQDREAVTARLDARTAACGEVLVGADGIHSTLRSDLWASPALRYTGYTAWRGVAPGLTLDSPMCAREYWGPGQRFGLFSLTGQRVGWWTTANRPERQADPPGGVRDALLRRLSGWPAVVSQVVEATPGHSVLRTDIYDRPDLPCWGRGRVTLLGDAAHPTSPNIGMGAGMAIDDACRLAEWLQHGDVVGALRCYERERRTATWPRVALARSVGAIGQWESPLACTLRTIGFRMVPASVVSKVLGIDRP